jgi:hypothetical protein
VFPSIGYPLAVRGKSGHGLSVCFHGLSVAFPGKG